MQTRIVYTDPKTNKLVFLTIPAAMFDSEHATRKLLSSQGIEFKSEQDIIDWVAKKDVPNDLEYHLVHIDNFPKSGENRDKWYYHKESNFVKDS